nr:cytochrome P450 [Tanacetum cinerariifolium]
MGDFFLQESKERDDGDNNGWTWAGFGRNNSHTATDAPLTRPAKESNNGSYAVVLTRIKRQPQKPQPNPHVIIIQHATYSSRLKDTAKSVIVELKTVKGASNTHNHILDEGFDDFSLKYLGGLYFLINLPDNESTTKLLANTSLLNHFKPWSNNLRITQRVTWITISGLPSKLWITEAFHTIASSWGEVIILEDCNPRQFNRTIGIVCILTSYLEIIQSTSYVPVDNDLIPIRIRESDGDIDSLFNGYYLDSSSDDEDANYVNEMDEGNMEEKNEDANVDTTDDSEKEEDFDRKSLPSNEISKKTNSGKKGVGNTHKKGWVKRLCYDHKINLAGIQETMIDVIDRFIVRSMWNNSHFDFVGKKSNRNSGGIAAIWDTSCFSLTTSVEGDGFLAVVEASTSTALRQKIDSLDSKVEISPLSEAKINTRTTLVKSLADLEHRNIMDLRQKAKIRWALEGDENSRFFHGMINNRRNRSRINGLNIHEDWVSDPVIIKNHVYDYFGARFKETNRSRPLFKSNLFKQFSSDEVHLLDFPFTSAEPASFIGDDSQGEACPTDSGLEAEQDRANIPKTSTLPSDSTPRVTFLAADEGSMQHKLTELTDLCTHLQRQQDEMASKITAQDLEISALKARIKHLEDKDRGDDDPSGEDATIKGRRFKTNEEAGIERSIEKRSDDTEEMVNVLTSLDTASVLSSGVQVCVSPTAEVATVSIPPAGEIYPISVPTGSGVVPTASPIFTTATMATPTASPIFTTAIVATSYTRRKGKEKKTQQRKPLSKKQQKEFYISVLRSHTGWKTKHFKGMTLEEIRENFDPVWKQIKDFLLIGSKEEGERFKRKGLRLE